MMKLTRSLSLLLAGLLCTAFLFACKNGDGKDSATTQIPSSEILVVSSSSAETTSVASCPVTSSNLPLPTFQVPSTTTAEPLTTLAPVTSANAPVTEEQPAQTTANAPLSTEIPANTTPFVPEPPADATVSEEPSIPESAYITCWGDSLTAMGGWTTRLQQLSGLTVYNGGVGGESSATIAARQGGDPIVVSDIVIPADCTPVVLATKGIEGCLYTASGYKAYPVMQGNGYNVNPVFIAGIRGTLAWTGSSYSDPKGTWTFTRLSPGEEVTIQEPTPIQTAYDLEHNSPYLMIIFMGTNGGYSNLDHLIRQHQWMIDHANAEHVIVLGLSSGTAEERAEYEHAMTAAFGDHFISLRQYLSTHALADAKLSPTKEDQSAMERGEVPPQLLMDSVHYTTACRRVIGDMLYRELQKLGIL